MSMANAVTPQTDYLKCYILHLHTHLLSPQGRLKLHQVHQIIQGLLTDILIFLFFEAVPQLSEVNPNMNTVKVSLKCF